MVATPRLRHLRYGLFARMRRRGKVKAFLTERNTTLGATGAAKTIAIATTPNLTVTAHGYVAGAGPFRLTTAGTLPTGLALLTNYWVVSVIDANTITLSTRRNLPAATYTNASGSGVHTITKSGSTRGLFDLLRTRKGVQIAASADVDNL